MGKLVDEFWSIHSRDFTSPRSDRSSSSPSEWTVFCASTLAQIGVKLVRLAMVKFCSLGVAVVRATRASDLVIKIINRLFFCAVIY